MPSSMLFQVCEKISIENRRLYFGCSLKYIVRVYYSTRLLPVEPGNLSSGTGVLVRFTTVSTLAVGHL